MPSNHSQVSVENNNAYFTSEANVDFCLQRLGEDALQSHKWLEPSAGAGAFANALQACGASIKSNDLFAYGYPLDFCSDFLSNDWPAFDGFIGNPPFGRMAGLAIAFFNHCAKQASARTIAFVLPKSFRKISVVDRLSQDWHLHSDFDLPSQHFILADGSARFVSTCFQVWTKKRTLRPKSTDIFSYKDYYKFLSQDEAESNADAICIRGQGASAGKVLAGKPKAYAKASTRFVLPLSDKSRAFLLNNDFTTLAGFSAGIPAIGINEIALGFWLSEHKPELLPLYLTKGFPSLVETLSQ